MGAPSTEVYTSKPADFVIEKDGKFFFIDTTVNAELGPYDTRELAEKSRIDYEQAITAG